MDKATVIAFLESERACPPAQRWAGAHKGPPAQMWAECPRYDWALWMVESLVSALGPDKAADALHVAWLDLGPVLAETFIIPELPEDLRPLAARLIVLYREYPGMLWRCTGEVTRIAERAHVQGNGRTDQIFRTLLWGLSEPCVITAEVSTQPRIFDALCAKIREAIPYPLIHACLEAYEAGL